MNLPWANRISPEIRIEFVGKMKGNYNNLSELCKEYNISRPTAYKWIAAYQDGYLCVRCEETPFFFLESKLCRSCKKVENLSLDEKVEREAQAIKCYGYSRMDELYSQGKLFKD